MIPAGDSIRQVAKSVLGHPVLRKLVLEIGPLVLFFVGFLLSGILLATAFFIVATVLATLISLLASNKPPVLPLVSTALVIGFGGATLLWNDPVFVMVRPTVANLFFAAVIGGSQWTDEPLLKRMFTPEIQISDAAWRALTIRVTIFLGFLALLNELTWRYLGLEAWVLFKVFAVMPLNVCFGITQVRSLKRYRRQRNALAGP